MLATAGHMEIKRSVIPLKTVQCLLEEEKISEKGAYRKNNGTNTPLYAHIFD